MATEFVPTSVTLTVDSVITNVTNMTIGENTYDRVAIVVFKTDRDDVHFKQLDRNTEAIIGVNWYGMYFIPYNSENNSPANVNVGIVCAGMSKTIAISMSNILTAGYTEEVSFGSGGSDA